MKYLGYYIDNRYSEGFFLECYIELQKKKLASMSGNVRPEGCCNMIRKGVLPGGGCLGGTDLPL